jgi:hypothetical protein
MRRRWRALRQLRGPREWSLCARALLFALAVPLVARLKLSTWSRWLERRIEAAPLRDAGRQPYETVLQCVDSALALGTPCVRSTCLVRGLTRYFFLRRAGLDLSLCFGATLKNGQLVPAPGHCWLEKDGQPFLEPGDPRPNFLPIYRLPEMTAPGPAARPGS